MGDKCERLGVLCVRVVALFFKMKQKLKRELKIFWLTIKSVPAYITVPFVIAIFCMNLLANKSIEGLPSWLALDCGIIVSWIVFLTMDMVVKRFGAKASTYLSIFAILVSLAFCLITFIGSIIPGVWGESFNDSGEVINYALNRTFGGTWYVLLGSTVAFISSAIINNSVNYFTGKLFKKNPNGAAAYFVRSYVSTAIGQFADNLIFAFLVSHFFFGWTPLQCVTCALTGMVAELLCEAVFSPIGYAVCRKWERNKTGEEYLKFIDENSEAENTEQTKNIDGED